jgi:hypothetical protein
MNDDSTYLLDEIKVLNEKTADILLDSKNRISQLRSDMDSYYDESAHDIEKCWKSCNHSDTNDAYLVKHLASLRNNPDINTNYIAPTISIFAGILSIFSSWLKSDG